MAGKHLREVRKAAVPNVYWGFVRKLETRVWQGNQIGFSKHLKTINLEGKRNRSSAYINDKDGISLRDVNLPSER